MKRLTWDELDQCKTADEIARLLRQQGVRGKQGLSRTCPLAVATGWQVGKWYTWVPKDDVVRDGVVVRNRSRKLTFAEHDFVTRFDVGEYSDLVEE